MHKSYTLMTFNIPLHLKSIFDELSSFKCVSKTSILNSLIENYCRQEGQNLIRDKEFIKNKSQIEMVSQYLGSKRNGLRNETIFLLSVKSGLRSKEISQLQWKYVLKSDGETIDDYINLPNSSSKGKSGRIIPLHKSIRENLQLLLIEHKKYRSFDLNSSFIVRTERSPFTSSQSVVNMFQSWYRKLGLLGCSSHSGRRTFITETSKKISLVGGSLRDIQMMVGHSSLQTTQRYIESDSESQRKVVNLI